MNPTTLISYCTTELDRMNTFALAVKSDAAQPEETIQYWLGRRDSMAATIRWAQNEQALFLNPMP